MSARGSSLSGMPRFNAPPGWNVPPDFVPSADWKLDPSWPPAPEGWNYWVDDAAPAAPQQPAYGTPAPDAQPYGSTPPAAQPYGASSPGAPQSGVPYGAPASPYNPSAPGSAHTAVAAAQAEASKKAIRGGLIAIAVGIVLSIVLIATLDRLPLWGPLLVLFGIITIIKGYIDQNKAKKAMAATQGVYGTGTMPGTTPPGVTQPGQNPPGTL